MVRSPTTVARVDLAALARNYERLARHVAPAGVVGVVKADAYGHGAVPVARALVGAGVRALAVTTVDEAVALRDAGLGLPLMTLGGDYAGAYDDLIARDVEPVVGDPRDLEALGEAAARCGARVRVHVKIDTGMSRLGVRPEHLGEVLRAAMRPGVEVVGLMTHLAAADARDLSPTETQLARFEECVRAARKRGVVPEVVHAANTVAALRLSRARYDRVRVGIGLYGAVPSLHAPDVGLEPALSVRTRVVALREVGRGDAVGYGSRWRAPRSSRIATLPVGYGDGYLRRLHERGEVLVRGRRAPVAGAVSMDLMMIDATDTGAQVGDEVVLLGEQADASGRRDRIRVEEIAAWADTVPYEILCGLARRVPRVHEG